MGGPVESIHQQAKVWRSYGGDIEVACLDSPSDLSTYGGHVVTYGLGPSLLTYGFSFRFLSWLRTNLCRYDIVVLNGIWTFSSFGSWLVLRRLRIPYVVFTHGMLDPWFRRQYPLKHLKKLLYWPWAEYRVLRDAARVLFTCEEERILARQSFSLYSAKEAVVLYGTSGPDAGDSVDDEFFLRFPELRGKRIALFLSRIHEKKGIDLLIRGFARAFAESDDWRLVVAGPGPTGLKRELKRIALEVGVASKIVWLGMVQGRQKWSCIKAAEVFVLPSHQENFGIVVAEALACGVPVLISNKVNIWREVKDAGAGLVDDDTEAGVVRLLLAYSVLSAEERLRMRGLALGCFEKYFEMDAAVRSLAAVLGTVLLEADAE
jgi:glycosyltransferase involved in cell wall biosynthesis